MIDWMFDGALVLALCFIGWRVIVNPELFKSIVFFIVFGLLMAVAWSRLGAPHVALAEAAIGAGITGALLLAAYRDMVTGAAPASEPARLRVLSVAGAVALASTVAVAALAVALLSLPSPRAGAGALADARLGDAGVQEPVTAVLLDFRGYDTLLEAAVLVLAVVAARAVLEGAGRRVPDTWNIGGEEPAMIAPLITLLAPLIVVVSGYLLWAGAYGPGGAFQAGAVLAALAVLLRLTGRLVPAAAVPLGQRMALVAGLTLFSVVGLLTMAAGRAFLDYPPGWGYPLILAIETALMISIALPLALLFSGSGGLGLRRGASP